MDAEIYEHIRAIEKALTESLNARREMNDRMAACHGKVRVHLLQIEAILKEKEQK